MSEEHPGRETLRRFIDGGLSTAGNREVLSHLLTGCERCKRTTASVWPAREERAWVGRAADPDWVVSRLRRLEESLEREKARAALRFAELERHPAERRVLLVRNSTGFQTLALGDLVLREAFNALFQDPRRALRLAELGVEIARALSEDHYGKALTGDFRARAWAHLGNARRVSSDQRGAEQALAIAEEALAEGSGDPLEKARFLDFKATLLAEQKRFEESLRLLEQAFSIYRRAGDRHLQARNLSSRATWLSQAGRPEAAIRIWQRAIRLMDPEREPRSVLVAKHNLVRTLHQCGRLDEALALLEEVRALHSAAANRVDLVRLLWLEGELAHSQGRLGAAERAYLEVRDEFVELEVPFDVAAVSLDLSRVYLEQGRLPEIRQLAAQMLTLFRALGVHREALAAAALFEQTARAEGLSLTWLTALAAYLRKAPENPGLTFRPT